MQIRTGRRGGQKSEATVSVLCSHTHTISQAYSKDVYSLHTHRLTHRCMQLVVVRFSSSFLSFHAKVKFKPGGSERLPPRGKAGTFTLKKWAPSTEKSSCAQTFASCKARMSKLGPKVKRYQEKHQGERTLVGDCRAFPHKHSPRLGRKGIHYIWPKLALGVPMQLLQH